MPISTLEPSSSSPYSLLPKRSEKRAHAIRVWPIYRATFAWVITITTSVITIANVRLILSALGL